MDGNDSCSSVKRAKEILAVITDSGDSFCFGHPDSCFIGCQHCLDRDSGSCLVV